jgi:hypothetical protein
MPRRCGLDKPAQQGVPLGAEVQLPHGNWTSIGGMVSPAVRETGPELFRSDDPSDGRGGLPDHLEDAVGLREHRTVTALELGGISAHAVGHESF